MKKIFTIIYTLLLSSASSALIAQSPSIGSTDNVGIPSTFQTVMFVRQKLPPKEGRKGSPYLLEDKAPGTIFTRNYGDLDNYEINYNLENREFDIYSDVGIKVLPDVHVDSFEILTPLNKKIKYLNLLHLTSNEKTSPLLGYAELIAQKNDILIIDKIEIKITKPNYNPATDTGEKAEKISVVKKTYLIIDKSAYKFPLNKNELRSAFGDKMKDIKEFAKREKLNLNKKEDFIESLSSLN